MTDWEGFWKSSGSILAPGEMWDRTKSAPSLISLGVRGLLPREGKALVPGCGRGYDVAFFASLGMTATGLEISPTAIQAATEYLSSQNVPPEKGKVIERDFFGGGHELYDLVYDYTFFCAIDPSLRGDWAKKMAELVRPGGKLVTLIFPLVEKEGGPPFGIKEGEVEGLLKEDFQNLLLEAVPHEMSFEDRRGKEKIAIWMSLLSSFFRSSSISLLSRSSSTLFRTLSTSSSSSSPSSSSSSLVLTKRHPSLPVATVILNAPPVNALTPELVRELKKEIEKIEADRTVRGLMLTSSSKNIFSAGIHLPSFLLPREELEAFWSDFQSVYLSLLSSRLISVAAINGHSPAGGCILSMACNQRVMLASSDPQKPFTIGLNEVQVGIPVPHWLCDRMVHLVGRRHAEEVLPVGSLIPTEKAFQIGLIDEVAKTTEELENAAFQRLSKVLVGIHEAPQVITWKYLRGEQIKRTKLLMDEDIKNLWKFLGDETFRSGVKIYMEKIQGGRKKDK